MRNSWLILLLAVIAALQLVAENNDDIDDFNQFCYPEKHKNTRRSCECIAESAPPWGMHTVHIDCSYKDLKTGDFSELLPLYADALDLSWNALDAVPVFYSDSLKQLNLVHNNVSQLTAKNFVNVSNLRELFLSWNSIQTIEVGAFQDLAHLRVLDLSHNNLHSVAAQLFSPMLVLETLSLSWNRQLNQSAGIQELDLYTTLGISPNLRVLRLEACSLTNVVLPEKAGLAELSLRRNRLTQVPAQLPETLEKLDLSDNLFEAMLPADTARLAHLQELYMEDMPSLRSVAENAFVPLQSLQKVSFQNCRGLTAFHEHAFGASSTGWPPLQAMIFRGSALRSFNSTLAPVFRQLTELDLNGMPLHCDCELIWVKELPLETNGRCFMPSHMRGARLTNARTSDFSCNRWPRWAYGLIVLGLIVLCATAFYFIVMGLRPHRGVTMRRKVGAGSPYARVTIEPNRQENTT